MKASFEEISAFVVGLSFTYYLNVFLKPELFWYPLVEKVLFVAFLLPQGVMLARFSLYSFREGRIYLFGASAASLFMAILALWEYAQVNIIMTPYTFFNIFRSILLASLFSFLERLLKLFEDRKSRLSLSK